MIKIYIIRHAETERNQIKKSSSGFDALNKNSALNDDGIFQAMKVGEYFKHTCEINAIYCSPVLRSFKTAELIFQFMKNSDTGIYFDERLYNFNISKDKKKLKDDLLELIESIHKKFEGSDKNILFVTHNHIIDVLHKFFVNMASDEELYSASKYKVDNCSISCVHVSKKPDSDKFEFHVEYWDKTIKTSYSLID